MIALVDASLGEGVVGLLAFGLVLFAVLVGAWLTIQAIRDARAQREPAASVEDDDLYDEGYYAGFYAAYVAYVGQSHSESGQAPEFPDLDEDQHPRDPAGAHAPAEGRVTVDEVTGYARIGGPLPVAILPLLSGQDGAA